MRVSAMLAASPRPTARARRNASSRRVHPPMSSRQSSVAPRLIMISSVASSSPTRSATGKPTSAASTHCCRSSRLWNSHTKVAWARANAGVSPEPSMRANADRTAARAASGSGTLSSTRARRHSASARLSRSPAARHEATASVLASSASAFRFTTSSSEVYSSSSAARSDGSMPPAKRSALSYWATASRCAPRTAARRAAWGAYSSTAAGSPASSAWWAHTAASTPPASSSPPRIA